MIVLAIIAILATLAVPPTPPTSSAPRKPSCANDLHVMRQAIDSFTYDKQKAPQTLDELIQGGYLKAIPKDPMTNRTDTWMPGQTDSYTTIDETQSGGIGDVHSGSQELSTEGTSYATW